MCCCAAPSATGVAGAAAPVAVFAPLVRADEAGGAAADSDAVMPICGAFALPAGMGVPPPRAGALDDAEDDIALAAPPGGGGTLPVLPI